MIESVQLLLVFAAISAPVDELDLTAVKPLIDASCLACHDSSTDTADLWPRFFRTPCS